MMYEREGNLDLLLTVCFIAFPFHQNLSLHGHVVVFVLMIFFLMKIYSQV